MRKYYFFIVLALIVTTVNAQVSISNGANIFLSSGSIFSTDMGVTLNGNAVIENNGDFDAASMSLNNSSTFTNNTGASFDLSNTLKLNNTSQFANNTGASSLVADSTIISSTFANTADFGSRYFDILNGGTLQNGGALQIQNALIASTGATFVTNTGALEFVGNDDNKRLNTDAIPANLQVGDIVFNASNSTRNIILESVVIVNDTANFNSGLVSYLDPSSDSLIVLGTGDVIADFATDNGIMLDALYRYPGVSGDSLLFPVGDNTGRFRPLWINSAVYPGVAPKIAVEYKGANTVTTNQLGYSSTFAQNSWGLEILSDSLSPSIVEVQFANGDVSTLTESVVAEGFSVISGDTIYYNLGNGGSTTISTNSRVKSLLPAQGNSILVIGQSTDLKLSINAILEGAWTSGTTMDTSLFSIGQLQSRFEFNSSAPTTSENLSNMMKNKPVPGSGSVFAIDSIKIILRDASNTSSIDTANAWLMSDGSVRDYLTGELPYAIFDNASIGTPYHVLIEHRNHLRVRSANTVTFANNVNPEFYDFTDPVNIYGGGGFKIISPSKVRIVAGNAFQDDAVNAIDYFQVGASANANDSGYLRTNILFNSGNGTSVNASDLSKTQQNSTVLYFSTWQ